MSGKLEELVRALDVSQQIAGLQVDLQSIDSVYSRPLLKTMSGHGLLLDSLERMASAVEESRSHTGDECNTG